MSDAEIAGLNPFEIRAGLLHLGGASSSIRCGLNPFEIRAGLLRAVRCEDMRSDVVLIPSKSGLGCYRRRRQQGDAQGVLIPSKSGLGCYMRVDQERRRNHRVLIPSKSGLGCYDTVTVWSVSLMGS